MINVGIVGGTGYTGVELLRLLLGHPEVRITVVTSRSDAGQRIEEVYPNLRGRIDLTFVAPSSEALAGCDVVFFATPHGTAMHMAPELLARGVKVIDLSADFRLKDPELWTSWYHLPHACPELLAEAVYGLPEIHRAALREARLIACPGCYPTAVQLGWWPLLAESWIDPAYLIADVKSGVSGAGRKAELPILMSETGESFKAYAASGHRHAPEIHQGLAQMVGQDVGLTFVPHLTPMIRGIHATLYAKIIAPDCDLASAHRLYQRYYHGEPFVKVLPLGAHPDTRNVRGSNDCHIALHQPAADTLIVLAVIDNLVKGASGQAIQAMNLAYALPETLGLDHAAVYP